MLPNPWSYSSMVRRVSSLFGSGKLANNGAISVNSKAGTLIVYLANVARNFSYFGVILPDSLIGAS